MPWQGPGGGRERSILAWKSRGWDDVGRKQVEIFVDDEREFPVLFHAVSTYYTTVARVGPSTRWPVNASSEISYEVIETYLYF